MNLFKSRSWNTPWLLVRFCMPITFILPFIVYWATLYKKTYPGMPAAIIAQATGILETQDLSNPIFNFAARQIAQLSWETLPLRLNSLSALCGALAVALFYLLIARIIFILSCEDSGGMMRMMPPESETSDNQNAESGNRNISGMLSHNALESIPEEVIEHNRRAAASAVLGALGAATTLAFCGPFWFSATRVHPYTFDLMLFFLILNLIISYDQKGRLFTLLLSVFLLACCSVESALFLLLAPCGVLMLYRAMKLNEQFTMGRVLFCIIAGLAGGILAICILWNAAAHCVAIPIPAPRPILAVFQQSVTSDISTWIPSYGWSRIFVLFLLPLVIGVYVFAYAFRIRQTLIFTLQLLLILLLAPTLINIDASPWGIYRLISRVPMYSYVIVAAMIGLLIASLHMMREMYKEKIDEDLDFYEYRDNPIVCRIGSIICWPLLLLTFCVPYFSYPDIDPNEGAFTSEVAATIFDRTKDKQFVLDIPFLKHEMLVKAQENEAELYFYSTDTLRGGSVSQQNLEYISSNPSFEKYRHRLINAADISPFSFMREWLAHDEMAYQKIVVYSHPGIFRKLGYLAVPCGFGMELVPHSAEIDLAEIVTDFLDFSRSMHPHMFPDSEDSIRLLTTHRNAYRTQLAFTGNELAVLLIQKKSYDLATEVLKHCELLAPSNLSIWLNSYHLVKDLKLDDERKMQVEMVLINWKSDSDLLNLSRENFENLYGTLTEPETLEFVKKRFWTKTDLFRNLALNQSQLDFDPLIELRNKKRQLHSSINSAIQANDFKEADSQLNILLDMDDSDHFALINKARIAILDENIPEAGLWLDLAKEAGVPTTQILWHEAALLKLQGQTNEVFALLNEIIPDNTTNSDLWTLLAEMLLQKGDFDQLKNRVYPALRNTSRLNENYMFYVVRGYLLRQPEENDLTGARSAFLKALALNPNLEQIEQELLKIDLALNVPAFMEEDAKKVLVSDPEHPLANTLMGYVRLHKNQYALAEDFFTRSLKVKVSPHALRGLAEVMLRTENFENADEHISRALTMAPDDIDVLHLQTLIKLAQRKTSEASASFEPVVKAKPKDLNVRLTMIKLMIQNGKLEDAAMIVSIMLDQEDYLPRPIVNELKQLASQVSQELIKARKQ